MKYLDLSDVSFNSGIQGTSGAYFKLGDSGLGVKLFTFSGAKSLKEFNTVVKNQYEWYQACNQAEALIQAEESKMTPKFYEILPVLNDGKYYIGIIMEHLEGSHAVITPMTYDLASELDYYGVDATSDLHSGNTIMTQDGIKFIDFSLKSRG